MPEAVRHAVVAQRQSSAPVSRRSRFEPARRLQARGSVTCGAQDSGCNPVAFGRAVRLGLSPPTRQRARRPTRRTPARLAGNRGARPCGPPNSGSWRNRQHSGLLSRGLKVRLLPVPPLHQSARTQLVTGPACRAGSGRVRSSSCAPVQTLVGVGCGYFDPVQTDGLRPGCRVRLFPGSWGFAGGVELSYFAS